jgi:hypothetical protein
VLSGILLGQRLRQPFAGIDLALRPRRAQLVDRKPRRDRREVRLRRLRVDLGRVVAEERLLHDVLGVRDRPEHPVRDREQVRPQLLLRLHAQ